MKTLLREAMTAGVFVEFSTADGVGVGQAVFTDWHGRPVPAAGDTLSCAATDISGQACRLRGKVTDRQFDVQWSEDGSPCVWVRLQVQTEQQPAAPKARRPRFGPSDFDAPSDRS